jgi:hypothetical protein
MLHSRDVSVSTLKRPFTEEALWNKRPVWIGIGQAWTNVDISAQVKKDPPLDVEIGRWLFMMTQGVSRAGSKRGRNSGAFDMSQGIGHLVRNDRYADKKLCILYGLIFSDKNGMLHIEPCWTFTIRERFLSEGARTSINRERHGTLAQVASSRNSWLCGPPAWAKKGEAVFDLVVRKIRRVCFAVSGVCIAAVTSSRKR